jgi:beta-N-acetylhexosaminidase
MFIAVDEEGGIVTRLAGNTAFDLPRYASAGAVGASGDPGDAREMGRTIGGYLREYGFNLDFAPVADVNTNPNNPVIGTRAFSNQPETAARMAAAFAQGLGETGIIATYKHFPGHGDTAEDSHSGLAVVYKTLEELETCEFLPFLEATSRDMVMVAHVSLPNVTGDMTPATLSRQIVTDILKEQLGFEGLIVTDAMEMGAIAETYGCGTAAVAALQAGCHILLIPENLPQAFDAVLAALEEGTLTVEWLDETVRKILEFKELHGIL